MLALAIVFALAAPHGVLPEWGGALDRTAQELGDTLGPPTHDSAPAPVGPWIAVAGLAAIATLRVVRRQRS